MSPTISVYRSPDISMDRNRLYKVLFDGGDVGEAWPGQRLSFDVAPGEHRVMIKIDLMRSNEVVVAPGSGADVDLTCTGRGSLRAMWNTLFHRHAYLDLHLMTSEERARWEASRPGVPEPRNLADGTE